MAGEKFGEREKNILEIETEEKLRKLARDFWFKYHLSLLEKEAGAEYTIEDETKIETAHATYERYLDMLENSVILPRSRVTEIINEVRERTREEAKELAEKKAKTKKSELN